MNESTQDVIDYQATEAPEPSEGLKALDRLIGEWEVTGGAPGRVRYEWTLGGFFLLQHVDLEQFRQKVQGFEVIGNLHPFGEPVSPDVASRFYDSQGNTFDNVYELEGDTLTIWAGDKGSPAYFRGTFSDGDRVMTGAWVYPGDGGYESTMTRI